ncbi:MAG: helix-hairpin-helix domain-containing protein [Nocardioides sp.]
MRQRSTSAEHHDAVARRLARLSDELADSGESVLPAEPLPPAAGGEWWAEATRISAARRPLALVPEQPSTVPSELPVPGRHAARRPSRVAEVLPTTLRGAGGLTPTHVSVVAVLVALGLVFTMWWVIRSDPAAPVTAPVTAPGMSQPTSAADLVEPAPGALAETKVTVDVAGRVRHPGIVVLSDGSRVVDALERAGGARPGVDLTAVNLARKLVDGEQILIGLPGVAPVAPPAAGGSTGLPPPLVDLNLATQSELETLPDIGPVTAASIVGWRDEHGGFSAVTELIEVDGIGQVTLERLTPLVTV